MNIYEAYKYIAFAKFLVKKALKVIAINHLYSFSLIDSGFNALSNRYIV